MKTSLVYIYGSIVEIGQNGVSVVDDSGLVGCQVVFRTLFSGGPRRLLTFRIYTGDAVAIRRLLHSRPNPGLINLALDLEDLDNPQGESLLRSLACRHPSARTILALPIESSPVVVCEDFPKAQPV